MIKLLERLEAKFPSLRNKNLDSTSYVTRTSNESPAALTFILKKVLSQLILSPLYLLFVLPLMLIGSIYQYFVLNRDERNYVHKYCEEFWYYPSLCIHKSLEGVFFNNSIIKPPSADIGCEDGSVTRLHYPGVIFDLGVEYIPLNLPKQGPYKKVITGGIPGLPEEINNKFNTISFVHIHDHIPNLSEALNELKECLLEGGKIYLSGLSNGFERNLKMLSFGLIDEKRLNSRRGLYHIISVDNWEKIFVEYGYEVKYITGFLGGKKGVLWVILTYFFEINGSNDLYYAANKLGIIPEFLKKIICILPVCWITAFFIRDNKNNPCNFFAELQLNKGQ